MKPTSEPNVGGSIDAAPHAWRAKAMGLTIRAIQRGALCWLAVLVVAGWCRAAPPQPGTITLPDWFEGNRVQAHSESNLEVALQLTPEGHANAIRSVGAHVLTRIFLNLGEGAWWPTQLGQTNPLIGNRDFATELIQAGHAADLKLVGYYRHMCDQAMQAGHPDWICLHPDGKPVHEVRAKNLPIDVLCMNSPYREYTKTHLMELADRGLDAIYFDSWHMPDICACAYCRKTFRAETGHEMDLAAKLGSPGYMEAVEFVNRTMVRTFTEWRRAVREKHPDVFFAVGSSLYPMYFSPHIDSKLLAISDTSKTEFHKPFGGDAMDRDADFARPAYDDQLALGWSVVRDASGGRPPLMWIPFLASEKTAMYSASAAVTYGCIASVNVPIGDLTKDMPENRLIFPSVFAMGDRVSPHLAHTRPMPVAALHVSERSRNARVGDRERMWREIFAPALGACQALRECHMPCVTLTDEALARGLDGRTKLLVLPWPMELTDDQKRAVARFEQAGGSVVRMNADAGWSSRSDRPTLVYHLKESIRGKAAGAPVRIYGPVGMHAMCYEDASAKRRTICLVNSWAWFRSVRQGERAFPEQPEPPACSDVTIHLAASAGTPTRVLEAVTGKRLTCEPGEGAFRIRVPTFQIFACVAVEY